MSPEKHVNIYEKPESLENELERLKHAEFSHPFYASAKMLEGVDLKDKNFVDIGAGTDSRLSKFVVERGAKYTAIDYNLGHLKSMKESVDQGDNIFFVRGDIKSLPLKNESAPLTHERFVLMHLPEKERSKAIEQILSATKDEALFLEYNWETLQSETHPSLVEEFKSVALEIMDKLKIESKMGKKLFTEVANSVKDFSEEFDITEARFERNGKFGKEILAMIKSLTELAEKVFKDEALKNKLINLGERINTELSELVMSPPDIIGVKAVRKNN